MYSINGGQKFESKKSLLKWITISMTEEEINKGVVYSDEIIEVYVENNTILKAILETDED